MQKLSLNGEWTLQVTGWDHAVPATVPGSVYHDLLTAGEMLAMRLCVLHNLHFYNELMAKIRQALDEGTFDEFRAKYSGMLDHPVPKK